MYVASLPLGRRSSMLPTFVGAPCIFAINNAGRCALNILCVAMFTNNVFLLSNFETGVQCDVTWLFLLVIKIIRVERKCA